MIPLHTSQRAPSCLHRSLKLLATYAGAALLLGNFPPPFVRRSGRASSDHSLHPGSDRTAGLPEVGFAAGRPTIWCRKSARLVALGSPGGFTTVAQVTAESATCQWVDPEGAGANAFYRIEIPGPQVFALEPAVLSPTGGDIFVRGQCLPDGSFLALEIAGQAPILVPLVPVAGQPGLWRAERFGNLGRSRGGDRHCGAGRRWRGRDCGDGGSDH